MSVIDMIFDNFYEHLQICDDCAAAEVSDVERCPIGQKNAEAVIKATSPEDLEFT